MLKEDERNVALNFFSDLLNIRINHIKEISEDWFLRAIVSALFPSAPEPVDPLRFLRATSPQLPWLTGNTPGNFDSLLVNLLALSVRAEAKDAVMGKLLAVGMPEQDTLRRLIKQQTEPSDENCEPLKSGDEQLRREIGNLRRQLETSNAENARLKSEFRKRETLLLQVVHSLGVKVGLQGLLDSDN